MPHQGDGWVSTALTITINGSGGPEQMQGAAAPSADTAYTQVAMRSERSWRRSWQQARVTSAQHAWLPLRAACSAAWTRCGTAAPCSSYPQVAPAPRSLHKGLRLCTASKPTGRCSLRRPLLLNPGTSKAVRDGI